MPCHISVFSWRKREKAPRENPPNGDFFVFSHGNLSPCHAKERHFSCVAFSPPVFRIFAWRGQNHHLACFRVATIRPARRYTFISGEFSPSICSVFACRGERSPRENRPRLKFCVFVYYCCISCFLPFAFMPTWSVLNIHYAKQTQFNTGRRKVENTKGDFLRVFAWRPAMRK